MTKYMHTINGFPATFCKDQICYAFNSGKANKLCNSLKEIRKQQKLTIDYRNKNGFPVKESDYGYRRFI